MLTPWLIAKTTPGTTMNRQRLGAYLFSEGLSYLGSCCELQHPSFNPHRAPELIPLSHNAGFPQETTLRNPFYLVKDKSVTVNTKAQHTSK